MRLRPKKKIKIRNKVIGGKKPLICMPIVADDKKDLNSQLEECFLLSPDVFEWRIDGFANVTNIDKSIEALRYIRGFIKKSLLIFTCRIKSEGGINKISDQLRHKLILKAIKTNLVDIVDIELCNSTKFIQSIVNCAKKHGVKVIISYHDFVKTPDKNLIIKKLLLAQNLNADIAKIAVMPKNYNDVLSLFCATLRARQEKLYIPIVAISMGKKGFISRVIGGLFGSDITFARGKKTSATGQISFKKMKKAISVFY